MHLTTKILATVAGKYFVAAELSQRGFFTFLESNEKDNTTIQISQSGENAKIDVLVKTRNYKGDYWLLSKLAEVSKAKDLFYVFVTLKDLGQRPDFYVVPSEVVAEYVTTAHKRWMDKPNRNGGKHLDSSVRKFRDKENKFLGKWELLEKGFSY